MKSHVGCKRSILETFRDAEVEEKKRIRNKLEGKLKKMNCKFAGTLRNCANVIIYPCRHLLLVSLHTMESRDHVNPSRSKCAMKACQGHTDGLTLYSYTIRVFILK